MIDTWMNEQPLFMWKTLLKLNISALVSNWQYFSTERRLLKDDWIKIDNFAVAATITKHVKINGAI